MSWHIVSLADTTPMPWRNGGGVTRELAAWPTAADWSWRMSVANVDRSGPFSKFDGIDRWFAVLDGAGVRLDVDEARHALTPADAPLFFDGAASTGCELINGPTRDFNLMVRRADATVKSSMRRIMTGGFSAAVRADESRPVTIAVYTASQSATINLEGEESTLQLPASTLAWRVATATFNLTVNANDALWMEIPA